MSSLDPSEPAEAPASVRAPDLNPLRAPPPPPIKLSAAWGATAIVLFLIVAGVAGASIWYLYQPQPLVVQGEADATRIDIAARVDGRVRSAPRRARARCHNRTVAADHRKSRTHRKARRSPRCKSERRSQSRECAGGRQARGDRRARGDGRLRGSQSEAGQPGIQPHQTAQRARFRLAAKAATSDRSLGRRRKYARAGEVGAGRSQSRRYAANSAPSRMPA